MPYFPPSHRSTAASVPRTPTYLYRYLRPPIPETTRLADNERYDTSSLTANSSLRQSPLVPGESKVPADIVTSPPNRTTSQIEKNVQDLHLVVLSRIAEKPVEPLESAQGLQKIAYNKSNTYSMVDPALHHDLSAEGTLNRPGRDYSDKNIYDDEPKGLVQKPPILRRKSGELIRPALRASSARRRPSGMPGKPTLSKVVHFDSRLEHVRHFLQVNRPLAVSAESSAVEAGNSDTEFISSREDKSNGRSLPYKWELVTSNFPIKTPQRLLLPVRVERVSLSADNKMLIGSVAIANFAFKKLVVVAEYSNNIHRQKNADDYERFKFKVSLADQANLAAKTMFFCVKYVVSGQEYWDNNNSANFQVDFGKKYKPENGQKAMQGAGSRTVHHPLPRNHKCSLISVKPQTVPPAFNEFANGFDARYKLIDHKESMMDFLAEPDRLVRLKGFQSSIHLGSDKLTRRVDSNGQAFGNRYDFSTSLSVASQAVGDALCDRSDPYMISSAKKLNKTNNAPVTESPISASPPNVNKVAFANNEAARNSAVASSVRGIHSPGPARTEKPDLGSHLYNELLDNYCFFESSKISPQIKNRALRSRRFDHNKYDGYPLGSVDSSVHSPLLIQLEKKSSPQQTRARVS